MKQAEHCGLEYPVTPNSTLLRLRVPVPVAPSELGSMRSHPTLNQTGELKAAFWRTRMWTSSSWKMARLRRCGSSPGPCPSREWFRRRG